MDADERGMSLLPDDPRSEPLRPHAAYKSSRLREPTQAPIKVAPTPLDLSGPSAVGTALEGGMVADLTCLRGGVAAGQRVIVAGRVLDENKRAVAGALVELWQANAAGRYAHLGDQWDAPLDPHFDGVGRVITDASGHYRFVTVRPGAYPWGNHVNAWRPAHIHFSVLGQTIGARLVTQMYFPDDPLIELDPIANAIPMPWRQRMVARLDMTLTQPDWALGYAFDIVLRGHHATPMEPA